MPIQRAILPDGRVLISGVDEIAEAEAKATAMAAAAEAAAKEAEEMAIAAAEAEAVLRAEEARTRAEYTIIEKQALNELEEEQLSRLTREQTLLERVLAPRPEERERMKMRELVDLLYEVAPYRHVVAWHMRDIEAAVHRSEFNRNSLIELGMVPRLIGILESVAAPAAGSTPSVSASPPASNTQGSLDRSPAASSRDNTDRGLPLSDGGDGTMEIVAHTLRSLIALASEGGHPSSKHTSVDGVREAIHRESGFEALVLTLRGYGTHISSSGSFARVLPAELETYALVLEAMLLLVRDHGARKEALRAAGALPRLLSLVGCSHRRVGDLAIALVAELVCERNCAEMKAALVSAGALRILCAMCMLGATETVQEGAARTLQYLVCDHTANKAALLQMEGGVASLIALLISGHGRAGAYHAGRCLVHLTHQDPAGKARVSAMLRETLCAPHTITAAVPPFHSDEHYTVALAGRPSIRFFMGCCRSWHVICTLASIELEPLRARMEFELTPQEEGLTTPRRPVIPGDDQKTKKKKKKGAKDLDEPTRTVTIFGSEAKLRPPRDIEEDEY